MHRLGIDLGGTKIEGVILDAGGQALHLDERTADFAGEVGQFWNGGDDLDSLGRLSWIGGSNHQGQSERQKHYVRFHGAIGVES